ncbi:MAG: hypothetical protein ACC608_06500 [Anaerofustis sp.]
MTKQKRSAAICCGIAFVFALAGSITGFAIMAFDDALGQSLRFFGNLFFIATPTLLLITLIAIMKIKSSDVE